MRALIAFLLLCLNSVLSFAQTAPQSQPASSNMLGMNCDQILAMSSSQWSDKFAKDKGDSTDWIEQSLAVYGYCYDQRTDSLASFLAEEGKAPLMGGTGNLRDMESALKTFTDQALAASAGGGTYDRISAAYANLYQKQFRYMFYQEYMNPDQDPSAETDPQVLDPAKERLGELMSQYKGQQGQSLQNVFQQFQSVAVECGIPVLNVYQYAITLMQPPADPPFSKPPL